MTNILSNLVEKAAELLTREEREVTVDTVTDTIMGAFQRHQDLNECKLRQDVSAIFGDIRSRYHSLRREQMTRMAENCPSLRGSPILGRRSGEQNE